MKKQIVNVSLVQSAKVIAMMYVLLSAPIVVLVMVFLSTLVPAVATVFLLLVPLLYGLISFVGVVVAGWLYNLAAGMVGGIEYTTSEV